MDRNLLGILFQPNPVIFFGSRILLKLKQHNSKQLYIVPLSPLKLMVFCLQNSFSSSYVILYRYSHHRCGLCGHSLKYLIFKIPWQCISAEVRWTGRTTSTKHFSLKYKSDEPFNYRHLSSQTNLDKQTRPNKLPWLLLYWHSSFTTRERENWNKAFCHNLIMTNCVTSLFYFKSIYFKSPILCTIYFTDVL